MSLIFPVIILEDIFYGEVYLTIFFFFFKFDMSILQNQFVYLLLKASVMESVDGARTELLPREEYV